MREAVLEQLRCPACRGRCHLADGASSDELEIRDGSLVCRDCDRRFAIRDGIADMLVGVQPLTRAEQDGWLRLADAEGWLDVSDAYLLELPRPQQQAGNDTLKWDLHADNFELLHERLTLSGRKVLDVGAGRCWSTPRLAREGAVCVALDIVVHRGVGLAAGEVLMRHDKTYFERILGDMAAMPFADAAFDIVLFTGALHHATDLSATLQEVSRVLRPGGQLALTNEACGGWLSSERVRLSASQEGINEHNYRFSRYRSCLHGAGFDELSLIPDVSFLDLSRARSKFRLINPLFASLGTTEQSFRWKMLWCGGVLIMTARKAVTA